MKDYYALFQGEVMTKNFLRSFQCNFNQTWYKISNERYYKNSKNTSINDNSGTTWIYFFYPKMTDVTMPTNWTRNILGQTELKFDQIIKSFNISFSNPLRIKLTLPKHSVRSELLLGWAVGPLGLISVVSERAKPNHLDGLLLCKPMFWQRDFLANGADFIDRRKACLTKYRDTFHFVWFLLWKIA